VAGCPCVPGGAVAGGTCVPGGCVAGLTGVGLGACARTALKQAKTKSARTSALINALGIWFDIDGAPQKKNDEFAHWRSHFEADRERQVTPYYVSRLYPVSKTCGNGWFSKDFTSLALLSKEYQAKLNSTFELPQIECLA
jgi:hypothetical protein